MMPYILDSKLLPIHRKILEGRRLSADDGMTFFSSNDLMGVGYLANLVREGMHGKKAYYIYNQHINYTNICKNHCKFCAFAHDEDQAGAYVLSLDEVEQRLRERLEEPISEIHVVGGIHPNLPWNYYLGLIKRIKNVRPLATVKAFTAVEIDSLSRISGLGLEGTLMALKDVGLQAMPGGGAEVFSGRLRNLLFPCKISANRWLEVMAAAHKTDIRTNATILYGHLETYEERIHHLMRLRDLQDIHHGFMAFIPLAFHSGNTTLNHLSPTTGCDDLKMIAISRLMLDNFPHIKAYWVMIGPKLAQVALSFGADDLDGTLMGEQISHTAGASTPKALTRMGLRSLIETAGYTPMERNAFYQQAA
jgi:aminodeoxyfutalosine synthase